MSDICAQKSDMVKSTNSVKSFFFCCKQKTAYEMRISDWSSDVCSSDLAHPGLRLDHPSRGLAAYRKCVGLARDWLAKPGRPQQIGRASCRERVYQYV